MENVILLVVLLGWVGAGAWWLAGRRADRVGDSVGDFKNQLGRLERRSPSTSFDCYPDDPTMPRDLSHAKPLLSETTRRRGEILAGLLFGAVLCTLIGTVPALRLLWVFAGLFFVLALTYGGLLWSRHTAKIRSQDESWFNAYGRFPGVGAGHGEGYYDEHGNWWAAEPAYDNYGQPMYDEYGQQVFHYVPVAVSGAGYGAENYQFANGYDAEGFDVYGYDMSGYDRYGFNREGFDAEGYDAYGYDADGYDRDGYPFEASDDDEYEMFWSGRGERWQPAEVYSLNDWRPQYQQAANY